MADRELSKAVVAVVGASGALGSRVARLLAERGAVVVPVGRSAECLSALGLDEPPVVVDVTDASAGEQLADEVRSRHGWLDGVVVASGVVAFGPAEDVPDEVVEELFLVNATGPLMLARRLGPLLKESKGFWVTISAVLAERPMAGMAAYSASKAAAAAFTQALQLEWRRDGVTVIDVRPPHTETGLVDRALTGSAPTLAPGLAPDVVAERVVRAIERGERQVASGDFA
jgi:NAD(P)-dependent dehydrogenase (short-subunit alcohol dehydrogenase family)